MILLKKKCFLNHVQKLNNNKTHFIKNREVLNSHIDEFPVILNEASEGVPFELKTANFAFDLSRVQTPI